jgi:hypothetical protein
MPKEVLDDVKTVCPARYVSKGSATFVPRLPKVKQASQHQVQKAGLVLASEAKRRQVSAGLQSELPPAVGDHHSLRSAVR